MCFSCQNVVRFNLNDYFCSRLLTCGSLWPVKLKARFNLIRGKARTNKE